MSRRHIAALVCIIAVLTLLVIVAFAVAQPGQPGAGQGFQGAGAGRDPGMRGMRMMGGMMGGTAIAVAGDAVFVVRGNMIYKFDAGTLELLAQAEIPQPQWPGAQPQ
jgi:hypothetical protein